MIKEGIKGRRPRSGNCEMEPKIGTFQVVEGLRASGSVYCDV